ncbi:MAG: ribosome maturation factor RimM [Cyclobacteriaceae bacterium]
MQLDDCYQLGEVIKTHGLHGEVSIHLDVDFPEEYNELESVFLKREGKLVPFFIDTIQINGNKALVKLEEVDSIDDAKALVKSEIYLPLSFLPKLKEGFYFHDLVDCEVYENDQLIGKVINVYDQGSNQLMEVVANEKEILIPLTDSILQSVDVDRRKVVVSLPDGLLDLYTSESE